MNSQPQAKGAVLAYGIAILGSFLVMAGLVWIVRSYFQEPGIDKARREQRYKALLEIRRTAQEQMESSDYIDKTKNRVRLPVQQAMNMMLREAQNPVAARSNLLARVRLFNPPPLPPAPPKPSEFE